MLKLEAARSPLKLELLLLFILTTLFFLFSYNSGFGYDALEYLNIGRGLASGKSLYEYVPSKSPLYFGYVSLLFRLFKSIGHFKLSLIITIQFLIAGIVCYWCTYKISGRQVAQVCSFFFLLSAFFTEMNFLEPEIIVVIFSIVAFSFFIKAINSDPDCLIIYGILCGVLLGFACLIKTVALFYLIGIAIILFIRVLVNIKSFRQFFILGVTIFFGFIIPVIITWLYFRSSGKADEFFFWTFIFPSKYYPGDNSFWLKTLIKLSPFICVIAVSFTIYLVKKQKFSSQEKLLINCCFVIGPVVLVSLYKSQASHYVFPALYFLFFACAIVLTKVIHIAYRNKYAGVQLVGVLILLVVGFYLYRPDAVKRFATLKKFEEEKFTVAELQKAGIKFRSKGMIFHDDSLLYYLLETETIVPFVSSDAHGKYFIETNQQEFLNKIVNKEADYVIFDPSSTDYRSDNFLNGKTSEVLKQFAEILREKYTPYKVPTLKYIVWFKK